MPTNAEIHEVVLNMLDEVAQREAEEQMDDVWIDKYDMPYPGDDWDY